MVPKLGRVKRLIGSADMATGMFGADVELLMEFSGTFEMRRETVDHAKAVVGPEIENVQWFGQDAENYKSTYGQSIPKALGTLSSVLVAQHDDLRRQAQEQDETSRAKSDEGCLEKTGDFFKGVADAVKNFFTGLANGVESFLKGLVVDGALAELKDALGLLGMNFDDGFSWNLDNAKQAWGDMFGGLGALIGRDPNTGEWSLGTAGEAWKNLGKGLVAWDKWKENPAEAFGETLWNVGSMLIPGVGASKASKMLNAADVPPPSKLDLDDAARRSDVDAAAARRADDSEPTRNTTAKDADGGAPAKLPHSVTQLSDGTIVTPFGEYPVERQHNNLTTRYEPESPDWASKESKYNADREMVARKFNDDGTMSSLEPNSLYHTERGSVITTDEHGLPTYGTHTGKAADILPSDHRNMPDIPAKNWPSRVSDEDVHGHIIPTTRDPINSYLGVETQTPKSNGGVGYGAKSENPQPHQQLMELRDQTYMKINPDADVTWEAKIDRGEPHFSPDNPSVWVPGGSPEARNIRISVDDGNGGLTPVDLTQPKPSSAARPELKPDADGWVRITEK